MVGYRIAEKDVQSHWALINYFKLAELHLQAPDIWVDKPGLFVYHRSVYTDLGGIGTAPNGFFEKFLIAYD